MKIYLNKLSFTVFLHASQYRLHQHEGPHQEQPLHIRAMSTLSLFFLGAEINLLSELDWNNGLGKVLERPSIRARWPNPVLQKTGPCTYGNLVALVKTPSALGIV